VPPTLAARGAAQRSRGDDALADEELGERELFDGVDRRGAGLWDFEREVSACCPCVGTRGDEIAPPCVQRAVDAQKPRHVLASRVALRRVERRLQQSPFAFDHADPKRVERRLRASDHSVDLGARRYELERGTHVAGGPKWARGVEQQQHVISLLLERFDCRERVAQDRHHRCVISRELCRSNERNVCAMRAADVGDLVAVGRQNAASDAFAARGQPYRVDDERQAGERADVLAWKTL
jgi:hypothetical protein